MLLDFPKGTNGTKPVSSRLRLPITNAGGVGQSLVDVEVVHHHASPLLFQRLVDDLVDGPRRLWGGRGRRHGRLLRCGPPTGCSWARFARLDAVALERCQLALGADHAEVALLPWDERGEAPLKYALAE